MGIPEREERGTESLFKEILAENFPKLERKMGIQIFEGHDPKQVVLEKGYPETRYNQSKVKDKEFGKQQGKVNYHIQEKSQKSTSRQTPCMPRGSKMIQSKCRKQTNLLTKNTLPGKATLQK